MRNTILALLALCVAGGATYYVLHGQGNSLAELRTATVTRGNLASTISATGTLQPEEVVDVGAQVMGQILEFGPDPKSPNKLIDFCSEVEQGTVLAKIDPTTYEAALEQAEASLERAKAELLQLEATLEQTEREWNRAKSLLPKKAIADTDYDMALANYKAAKANMAVGKANIRQSMAALRVAKTNLGYTTIKSPVRGVIIARRVNMGQTVVSSFNAPSLFLIAKDLKRMQVWAQVNEADIGQIRLGMPVRFTVDPCPGETFRGTVTQIRLNATMTQNVVIYTVVVTTDNDSGKLKPYLTTNVQFELDDRENVLLTPNAALRWTPSESRIDPTVSRSAAEKDVADAKGSTDTKKDDPEKDVEPSAGVEEHGQVWVETHDGLVRPIEVVVGTTDGVVTEIRGEGVEAGMRVVVGENGQGDGEEKAEAGANQERNPFLPKPPKGFRRPRGPM